MLYRHQQLSGELIDLPVGKVVCVGRNYADHAKELNNALPTEPLLFIKPATSLTPLSPAFSIPDQQGDCHYETEIALLISEPLCCATQEQAKTAIWGLGVGLDLTLRAVQTRLKKNGHPWERAKAFDGACPMSAFIACQTFADLQQIDLSLTINDKMRQQGNSAQMLFPMLALLAEISQSFTLLPGDLVLTGTPAGVGALQVGDQLVAELDGRFKFASRVV